MERKCARRFLKSTRAVSKTALVIIAIVIIAVAAVAAYYLISPPAPTPPEVEEIKIIGLYPLSGPLTPYGETITEIVEWYTTEFVNEKGGIESLDGAEVKFTWIDVTSDPKDAAIVAERELSKAEKPPLVLGSYSSKLSVVTAPVAEKYEIPFHVYTGTEAILTYGYRYVFRGHGSTLMALRPALEFMSELMDQGVEFEVVLLNEDTMWGHSTSTVAKKFLEEMDITVVTWEEYDAAAVEFTGLVSRLKAIQTSPNPAEILIWTGYLLDQVEITMTMKEMDVNFDFITTSCQDIRFGEMVGAKDAEGFSTVYHSAGGVAHMIVPEIASAFEEHFGRKMTDVDAMAVDQGMLVQHLLEEAGSTDPEDVREAFYRIDYEGPVGRVKFLDYTVGGMSGPLLHQNPYAASSMSQWKDGKLVTVRVSPGPTYPVGIIPGEVIYPYPTEWAEGDFIYPMPTWTEKT